MSSAPLMVSISGVRGISNESITPELVVQYVAAFSYLQKTRHPSSSDTKQEIVLVRDSRVSGPWIEQISAGVIQSMGLNVVVGGIQPTPTGQLLALIRENAIGALVITSSHNPVQWNGLKFVDKDGLFLSPDACESLFKLVRENSYKYPSYMDRGVFIDLPNAAEIHINACVSLHFVKVEEIRARNFKVVLDSVNGAGGPIMKKLLETLGCTVVGLNIEPTGIFAHTPEPVPENLSQLCEAVKANNADFGVAVDPDVDRFVMIDEQGKPLGEEYTLAFAVEFYLSAYDSQREPKLGEKTPICKNLSSSRVTDDIAKKYGCPSYLTPVGEIHVANKMVEVGAIIGGEGNGGIMLPDVHIGRDALVAATLIVQYLSTKKESVSAVKATFPQYEIVKLKAPVAGLDPDTIIAHIKTQWEGKEGVVLNDSDGLRIDTPEYWVHMRKSNTEPIIRVIGEHQAGFDQAKIICEKFMNDIVSASVK